MIGPLLGSPRRRLAAGVALTLLLLFGVGVAILRHDVKPQFLPPPQAAIFADLPTTAPPASTPAVPSPSPTSPSPSATPSASKPASSRTSARTSPRPRTSPSARRTTTPPPAFTASYMI